MRWCLPMIFLIAAASILLGGCVQNDCSKYVEGTTGFNICDVPETAPDENALDDMRRGVFRLYSTDGYSEGIPGVSISIEEAGRSYDVVNIAGTTDYATDTQHGFYIRRAGAYASNYNKTVITRESEFRHQ